jgi:NhaP-type Na+/H+ or K+/H+ antiporter
MTWADVRLIILCGVGGTLAAALALLLMLLVMT